MDAIGVADRNTLAGVVRMHSAAKGAGLRPLIGCRLDLERCAEPARLPDRPRRLWPAVAAAEPGQDARRQGRVRPAAWPRSRSMREGIAFIAWPGEDLDAFEAELPRLREALAVAAPCRRGASLSRRRYGADRAARPAGASAWLHHPRHQRRPLSRARPAAAAGRDDLHPREGDDRRRPAILLNPNAERHLKSPEEMARLFARWPHAIAATREFADALALQPRRAALRISARDACPRAARRSSISSI